MTPKAASASLCFCSSVSIQDAQSLDELALHISASDPSTDDIIVYSYKLVALVLMKLLLL